ncbi:MAG: hypothetical protein DRI46_01715 [Chloroflexi bacterium]|nr:MAG: hypothetical protein DRI46_01715 [Chloroflexota bacterium]
MGRKRNPCRLINNGYGAIHAYPDLMGQSFRSNGTNQIWGRVIICIPTQRGFVYLAVIKDFFDAVQVGDDYIHFNTQDHPQLKWKLTPLNSGVSLYN